MAEAATVGGRPLLPLSLVLYAQMAPPKLVVAAFAEEHSRYTSVAAQQCFLDTLIRHPHLEAFPPKRSYIVAVCKLYLSAVEDLEVHREVEMNEEGFADALVEFYARLQIPAATSEDLGDGMGSGPGVRDERLFYRSYPCGSGALLPQTSSSLLPIRVAPTFSNVGLALWPSGFVLLPVLAHRLRACTHRRRIFELGAGVGLTAALLPTFLDEIETLILTDYQGCIVENCRENVNFTLRDRAEARAATRVELLDWTETETTRAQLQEWRCDYFVAADVVYDRSVIDALVTTIAAAFEFAPDPANAEMVLVQTRRNPETMRHFETALAAIGGLKYAVHAAELFLAGVSDDSFAAPTKKIAEMLEAQGLSFVGGFLVEMLSLIDVFVITRA